jgi:NADH-ubiquinone oxidoreductase chain 5
MLIGSLALIGFPFLAGFYSKDVILEISFAKYTLVGLFSYILGTLAAFCTAFYSTRLLYLVFLSEPNGNKHITNNAHEGSWRMTLPLFLLSLLSILVGYLTKDLFIGFGTDFWNSSIFILPSNYTLTDIEFININFKILPLLVTISGVLYAFFLYQFNLQSYLDFKKTDLFKNFYTFFNKKWYFDRIYNQLLSQSFLSLSYNYFYKNVDRGLVELVGPTGIITDINMFVYKIKPIQSGYVLNYLLYFLVSIATLTFFPFSILLANLQF